MGAPNFRDERFWIELRKKTSVDGWVGVEECYSWCREALKLLSEYREHNFRMIEGVVSSKTVEKYRLLADSHYVLARKYKERIFIADGTAGQFFEQYPLGYYGFVRDVPEPLSLFYRCGIRRANMAPKSSLERILEKNPV